jgi:hypothetical protein
MATEAQVLANRQNALKSTGPRTLSGKQKVSQNALLHGLSANQAVINTENRGDFELYCDTILDELEPVGAMETILAERIISLSWRLKRAVLIQNQTFNVMSREKNNSLLEQLTKSLTFKCQTNDNQSTDEQKLVLGRLAIKDLSGQKVLERLLLYERRIEQSLYKTILELQRLKAIRKTNPLFSYVESEESSPNTLI